MEYDFLVGIAGISMSGLAKLLEARGHKVAGSDLVLSGHKAENITPDITRLIISSAVQPGSPGYVEVEAAEKLGIPVIKRSQAIGELLKGGESIAVAGTHGKTSTTTIVGELLEKLGADPTVLVGGEVPAWGGTARVGGSEYTVIEACEYDKQILDFPARHAIMTSLEPDHFDTYPTEAELIATFGEWLAKLSPDGYLVLHESANRLDNVLDRYKGKIIRYGTSNGILHPLSGIQDMNHGPAGQNHISGYARYDDPVLRVEYENIIQTENGQKFSIVWSGGERTEIETNLSGEHQAANLTAAITLLKSLGHPLTELAAAAKQLQLAKRRMENVGEYNGAPIFDDYGHHPTEITVTLKSLKQRFPGKRLVLVFQSHQISRTKELLPEFAQAISLADHIYLLPVFKVPGRDLDTPTPEVLQQQLADQIIAKTQNITAVQSYEECIQMLKQSLTPNDILLTMGATRVYEVAEALARGEGK